MKISFRRSRRNMALVFASAVLVLPVFADAPDALQVSPATFDFGWCPDNAMVSAQFVIKNTSAQKLPITAVQPSCGCTAADFSPESLSTNEETKVGLTFNTRGYGGIAFKKSAKVKTDTEEREATVWLTGHVTNSTAKFAPVGSGVLDYEPGSTESDKKVQVKNLSDKEISVQVIQEPAGWAKLKLASTKLAPGAAADVEVKVKGPYTEAKNTSFTLEGTDGTETQRVTVAVRTGPAPRPYRRIEAPKTAPVPAPVPANVPSQKSAQ